MYFCFLVIRKKEIIIVFMYINKKIGKFVLMNIILVFVFFFLEKKCSEWKILESKMMKRGLVKMKIMRYWNGHIRVLKLTTVLISCTNSTTGNRDHCGSPLISIDSLKLKLHFSFWFSCLYRLCSDSKLKIYLLWVGRLRVKNIMNRNKGEKGRK